MIAQRQDDVRHIYKGTTTHSDNYLQSTTSEQQGLESPKWIKLINSSQVHFGS